MASEAPTSRGRRKTSRRSNQSQGAAIPLGSAWPNRPSNRFSSSRRRPDTGTIVT